MTALTPEAVAHMVADLRKVPAELAEEAADMLATLAAENSTLQYLSVAGYAMERIDEMRASEAAAQAELATLRAERDGWRNTVGAIAAAVPLPRIIAVTGTVHDMVKYFTDLVASEAAAVDRVKVLEAQNRSAIDSRDHFKLSAGRQKERCSKLRHRQRALLSELAAIRSADSLDDAKFRAHIAISGWSDDDAVFKSRTAALTPTADKEPKT